MKNGIMVKISISTRIGLARIHQFEVCKRQKLAYLTKDQLVRLICQWWLVRGSFLMPLASDIDNTPYVQDVGGDLVDDSHGCREKIPFT